MVVGIIHKKDIVMIKNNWVIDTWIPVNLKVSTEKEIFDLSDFYVITRKFINKNDEPFCFSSYEEYIHDGKDGLINKNCNTADETSFTIYAVDSITLLVVTKENILSISLVHKGELYRPIDPPDMDLDKIVHHENISDEVAIKILSNAGYHIKDIDNYITDPEFKNHFVELINDGIRCKPYFETLSRINTAPTEIESSSAIIGEHKNDDDPKDYSDFIVITQKWSRNKLFLQLHDGVEGLFASKIVKNSQSYVIENVNGGIMWVSYESRNHSYIILIGKHNKFLLENMGIFNIAKDDNQAELDIQKLKLYLIATMFKNSNLFNRLVTLMSYPHIYERN